LIVVLKLYTRCVSRICHQPLGFFPCLAGVSPSSYYNIYYSLIRLLMIYSVRFFGARFSFTPILWFFAPSFFPRLLATPLTSIRALPHSKSFLGSTRPRTLHDKDLRCFFPFPRGQSIWKLYLIRILGLYPISARSYTHSAPRVSAPGVGGCHYKRDAFSFGRHLALGTFPMRNPSVVHAQGRTYATLPEIFAIRTGAPRWFRFISLDTLSPYCHFPLAFNTFFSSTGDFTFVFPLSIFPKDLFTLCFLKTILG